MTDADSGKEGVTDADSGKEGVTDADPNTETGAPVGRTRWAIPGGHVPVDSTGPEPEMVSRDELCVLNAGEEMASVAVTLHYPGGREAGPYHLTVAPRRVRHVRVNDLIDPYAPPLGRDYGAVVESDVPVVVQFTRQDTRQDELATLSTVAYPERE